MYGSALGLAIEGPTRPPATYYEKILARARSFDELRKLVRRMRPKQINRDTAGLVARLLAQAATTTSEIEITALDEEIDRAVRTAFRSLIVAAGTPEGREALLGIITDAGEQASGLEVDAIIAGLAFDESVQLMRFRWTKLSSHHRSVALDAITAKATNSREQGQARRLRELYAISR